jgi:ribosomal protein S18 acetylase RimI-like enzyme
MNPQNTHSGGPTIRTAKPEDYKAVAELIFRSHTISFKGSASSEWVDTRQLSEYQARWRESLAKASTDAVTIVASIDGQVVGTVSVSPLESPEFDAQLYGMHVDPAQTGRGIGGLLIQGAMKFIRERKLGRVELGVIAANSGARRFYETHGWKLVRELPDGIEGVPVVIYELT